MLPPFLCVGPNHGKYDGCLGYGTATGERSGPLQGPRKNTTLFNLKQVFGSSLISILASKDTFSSSKKGIYIDKFWYFAAQGYNMARRGVLCARSKNPFLCFGRGSVITSCVNGTQVCFSSKWPLLQTLLPSSWKGYPGILVQCSATRTCQSMNPLGPIVALFAFAWRHVFGSPATAPARDPRSAEVRGAFLDVRRSSRYLG